MKMVQWLAIMLYVGTT